MSDLPVYLQYIIGGLVGLIVWAALMWLILSALKIGNAYDERAPD